MRKKVATIALAATMVVSMSSTVFAASWQKNDTGWWWQEDNGSYPTNTWQWIDGNNDGIAECYYFNESGYCLLNTTTPDGYSVNEDGAWVADGAIQKKSINDTGMYGIYRSEDPEDGFFITLYEKDGVTRLAFFSYEEDIELSERDINRITKEGDIYYFTFDGSEYYNTEMYGTYRSAEGNFITLYEKDGVKRLQCNSFYEEVIELSEEDINDMVTKDGDTYRIVMNEKGFYKE